LPETDEELVMNIAYLVVTLVLAAMAAFSALGKLRRDPQIVHVIHEVVGVPLNYFPHLAACEFAGALGLVLGIWWPILGMAAGIWFGGYFVGAIVSHLHVGDAKGIGPAAFMLSMSVAALALWLRHVLALRSG
jgi:DoxX-like family